MPRIIGITPDYGIPSQEDGLLLESLDFSWVPEWFDQKNNQGRLCGRKLVDEQIDFSMSGATVLGSNITLRGGQTFALINEVPDLWNQTPDATTIIVGDIKYNYSSTDARKAEVSGSIYAFAEDCSIAS